MSELRFDRLIELRFHEVLHRQIQVDYLLQLTIDETGLNIELEDKQSGSMWSCHHNPKNVQDMTYRAKNFKDFAKFSQMLIDALLQPNAQEVSVDLLDSSKLEQLNRARSEKGQPERPLNRNPRLLVLNYQTNYEKISYPLSLNFEEVPQERLRLRLVIRRLRSELEIYRRGGTPNALTEDWMKESMSYKQENEVLKAKLRKLEDPAGMNNSKMQQSQVRQLVRDQKLAQQNSHLKELVVQTEEELKLYKSRFQEKERQNTELNKELKMMLKQITRIEEIHKKQKEELSKKVYQDLSIKLNDLTKQTSDLVSDLNFSREQEKKSKIRIGQLEKELESVLKRTTAANIANTSSGYIKRPGTPTSQRKSDHKLQPDKTKRSSVRKRSVVDSDTESSRMRKANNNRVSPFRNSKVGMSPGRSQPINRSRSKQNITTANGKKNTEKKSDTMSPRSNIVTESEQNIDPNFASDSDSEGGKISQTMAMLRRNREEKLKLKDKKLQGQSKQQTDIEKKIGHIAQILRRSTRKD